MEEVAAAAEAANATVTAVIVVNLARTVEKISRKSNSSRQCRTESERKFNQLDQFAIRKRKPHNYIFL
jgi:hypothetical protein